MHLAYNITAGRSALVSVAESENHGMVRALIRHYDPGGVTILNSNALTHPALVRATHDRIVSALTLIDMIDTALTLTALTQICQMMMSDLTNLCQGGQSCQTSALRGGGGRVQATVA